MGARFRPQIPDHAGKDKAGARKHERVEGFAVERPPDQGDQRNAQEVERNDDDYFPYIGGSSLKRPHMYAGLAIRSSQTKL
jgi:hypothetical protein